MLSELCPDLQRAGDGRATVALPAFSILRQYLKFCNYFFYNFFTVPTMHISTQQFILGNKGISHMPLSKSTATPTPVRYKALSDRYLFYDRQPLCRVWHVKANGFRKMVRLEGLVWDDRGRASCHSRRGSC